MPEKTERRIFAGLGEAVREKTGPARIAVITDENVAPLYLDACREALGSAGLSTEAIVVTAGEAAKSGAVYLDVMDKLARIPLTRTDAVLALGGGVTGDLAGFVAATYLRGIPIVQVPTTLLAMVDSSIGGKTAINLPAGKNLCGAFHLPCLIYRELQVLDTLPEDVFRDGLAEILKYGMIADAELFRQGAGYQRRPAAEDPELQAIIRRCVEIKEGLTREDPLDTGCRQLLNFGHTIGHAIEKLSNYAIPHGAAVARGMEAVTAIAVRQGWCDGETLAGLRAALLGQSFRLGVPFPAEAVYAVLAGDKKRKGDMIDLVIPERIGSCVLRRLPVADLRSLL